jgi:hypothetical protein
MHVQCSLSLFSPFLIPHCPSLSLFLSSVALELTLSCSSSLGWSHCVSFLYSIFQCKLLGQQKSDWELTANRERSNSPTLFLPLSQMRGDDPSLLKKGANGCLFCTQAMLQSVSLGEKKCLLQVAEPWGDDAREIPVVVKGLARLVVASELASTRCCQLRWALVSFMWVRTTTADDCCWSALSRHHARDSFI